MIKKMLVLTAATLMVATGASIATAHHNTDHKPKGKPSPSESTTPPPCYEATSGWDIIDGSGGYTFDLVTQTGNLSFRAGLAAASCPDVTYSFFVLDGLDPAEPFRSDRVLYTEARTGDGTSESLEYDVTITNDNDTRVCVYHEVWAEGQLLDRAPDAGCLDLPSTGANSYR